MMNKFPLPQNSYSEHTRTRSPNRPPVHNCKGPSLWSLHTEWWLPRLLHLFGSFGRSNLQKALSIFAIIGTEMPHHPYSASLLSASQLSGQFVKPRHYFFSSKSITSLGWGEVRKGMKIKLFSPCHTKECSCPSLEMSASTLDRQQKQRRERKFARSQKENQMQDKEV